MTRTIRSIVLSFVLVFVALYLGDWAVFMLRGSPTDSVAVRQYLAIPLKGNKTEFDSAGTANIPCSRSLFPQDGFNPCWKLKRQSTQQTTL